MKYKYLPLDIANYIYLEDLRFSEKERFIEKLFSEYKQSIAFNYRNNINLFKKEVNNQLDVIELYQEDFDEANIILSEISNHNIFEEDINEFGYYFKFFKLQFLFSKTNFRKMKLRTLLKDFGYKRRTAELVKKLTNALSNLKIKTYLKNYEPCNIADVNLDEIIIFRLD